MTEAPILYSFRRCPYVGGAIIAANEQQLEDVEKALKGLVKALSGS